MAASVIAGSPRVPKRKRALTHSAPAVVLVGPFLLVLVVAGALPAVYALVESLISSTTGGFAGLSNYLTVITNFRFLPSFGDVGLLLLVWLPIMVVGVVGLALLVDASRGRFGKTMLFVYYIPAALAGITNFMLWLLILDPNVSPIAFFWKALGQTSIDGLLSSPINVIWILAAMLFYEGSGSWLLIVLGGLHSISDEVIEAAEIDGCNQWRLAWRIKLPMIAPWIGYLVLMNFAYGFQIFLEPQLLAAAAQGILSPQWSPNQLSYTYAYSVGNTGAAAALSVILLIITLGLGVLIVTKTGLLERS
ncbi:MAG: sugar ABC transporter permease [Sulfobacillus acidophilus]|uniref:Sugar ABC transporter permease n=1 Tax=Sulfobacillus acidophilus TaxID=53633 RepID=A0A2T2WF80_9FIRM|nr:MAG: sugar ABC transporter permease [Sulfobacillus acidophilus]